MPLHQIVEPRHAGDGARELGRERRLPEGGMVPSPAEPYVVYLTPERPLKGSDAPTRADDETVRSPVGHPESTLLEVRHHCRLVRVGRGVERVELLLAQELPVARRRRILNGGE